MARPQLRAAARTVSDLSDPLITAFERAVGRLQRVPEPWTRGPSQERGWSEFSRAVEAGMVQVRTRAWMRGYRAALADAPRFGVKAKPAPRPATLELQAAAAWASSDGSRLVVEITEDTRGAIQEIVTEGIALGANPRVVARDVRDVVGLTSREARAVRRRRILLEAQHAPGAVERMVAEYHQRLVRLRAERIARTEIIAARNEGTLQGWQYLQSVGGLRAHGLGKMWIAALELACPRCAPLHMQKVPLDDVFSNGRQRPPDHPHCRCSMGLVELG